MLKNKKQKIDWSDVLFFSCAFFLAGVFVFSFLDWGENVTLFIGLFFAILVLYVLFFKNKSIMLLFFVVLSFFLGVWVIENEKNKLNRENIPRWISGYFLVTDLPEDKRGYQKVVGCFQEEEVNHVAPERRDKSLETFDCKRKTLIFGSLSDVFNFGDVFRVKCQISSPENKYPKFNYVRYLAKDDIYQICSQPSFLEKSNLLSETEKTNLTFARIELIKLKFFGFIYDIRAKIEEKIKNNFREPGAGYLAGLLIGGEDRLPEKVAEDFRRTGTTHTVAVSGYNITIIAAFLMWVGILIGFWRQKAFWLATVGIVFFIFMIGAPSSAVRAAVMGILILWAAKNGKLSNSWRAIVFAAFLMVTYSPFVLVYDAGFQLSFLATLSLVFLYTPLAEKFEITNDFLEIKSILLMTIVAQLGVLGLIVYSFESFSLLSLLANLIILPIIPIIMLGGFLVTVTSFFLPALAEFLAMPVQMLLDFEIRAVSFLADFKWASVEFSNLSVWWLVGYYLFFIGLILKYNYSMNIKKTIKQKPTEK